MFMRLIDFSSYGLRSFSFCSAGNDKEEIEEPKVILKTCAEEFFVFDVWARPSFKGKIFGSLPMIFQFIVERNLCCFG